MNQPTSGASLATFSNSEFEINLIQDGEQFKVAAPGLARALGFREAHDLLRSVPGPEKGSELVRTPGGDQRVGYVTEPGFYRVMGQRQPSRIKDPEIRLRVERFQSWVYSEVLPSIRRHGTYMTGETIERVLQDPRHSHPACHPIEGRARGPRSLGEASEGDRGTARGGGTEAPVRGCGRLSEEQHAYRRVREDSACERCADGSATPVPVAA